MTGDMQSDLRRLSKEWAAATKALRAHIRTAIAVSWGEVSRRPEGAASDWLERLDELNAADDRAKKALFDRMLQG